MANNITVKDASGSNVVVKSTDNASVQLPAHQVTDSTGANALAVSSAGAAKFEGAGTAGTGAGGVLTIQGNASGTAVPVSGTVTATVGTVTTVSTVTSVTQNADVRQGTAANLNATVVGAGSAGTANAGVVTVQGIASMTPLVATGSGTAGSAATGVVSVQGIASMTPVQTTGTGTAGSAATGVSTIQGISSMTPVQVSQATASNLNALVAGTGTAGSAASGVVTVQGVTSMTPVQVSQATASSLNAAVVGTGTAGSAAGGVLTVQGVASMTPLLATGTGTAGSAATGVITVQGIASGTAQSVSVASGGVASGAIASGAFASGSIGSGAVASGAIASGAVASGAFASGALASGSIASGAMVDLVAEQTPITPTTATATKGLLIGGQYNSSQATFTTGQQGALQISSRGELKSNIMDAAGNARGANVTAANEVLVAGSGTAGTASAAVVTVQGIASMTKLLVTPDANSAVNLAQVGGTNTVSGGVNGSQSVGGPTASGSSVAANPVTIGGRGATANPTAVADAQVVNAMFDKLGKQVCVGAIRTLKGVTQTQISNSTAEVTIVAQVASTFQDLYGLVLANTGATTTKVTIKDSTSGTTRMIFEVPTLETRGFMVPVDSAIPQATVNTNWTATCTSATTAMEVTALWVSNI